MSAIVPRCFRRDEPPERMAARVAALVERLERLEAAYWNELNDEGRYLVRRAGFTAFMEPRLVERLRAARAERRVLAVDGDTDV